MGFLRKYSKIVVLDVLAVLCFIGVILFGWLPGPGGIPLFIAGLTLLAVNHDWAERWLETAKLKGKSFKTILFPPNPWVRHVYDALSILLFMVGTYLFFTTNNRFVKGLALGMACFTLFVFLVNRERLDKLFANFKSSKHKHIK